MQNYTYSEMQAILFMDANVELSLRTLKRILCKFGLRRKGSYDLNTLKAALMTEIEGSGQRLGCRMMVHRLLGSHGISVGRDKVLQLMYILDPEGVNMRKKRHCLTRRTNRNLGPNFLIHIDGNDKLKRYGLAIHGAICGFSRKVLWLRVNRTNNDPDVIASYYLNYIRHISGAPRCLRIDAGTENTKLINMQKAIRWHHGDDQSGEKVSSLEALILTRECFRFCFTKVLQKELDQVRTEWNSHRVRPSAEQTQCGKPDLLYNYPELFGTSDFKFLVESSDIDELEKFTTKPPAFGCPDNLTDNFRDILTNHGKEMPETYSEAKCLYIWLIQKV